MFGSFAPDPLQDAALARVEALARRRFRLQAADTMMVTELACAVPGCPPLETVIVFWPAAGTGPGAPLRHHCKVFKPVQHVDENDLPPWWMKNALATPPDWECGCC